MINANILNVTKFTTPLAAASTLSQVETPVPSPLKVRRRKTIKQVWKRNRVRKTLPVYWRRLVEVGVPVQAADILAKAIAQYDAVRQVPNTKEQQLIHEYCRFICRAELWRSQLLSTQTA
ncbi:MAG: hypothetical protein F6K16_37370 [Symploca sp. SIO2B6]|nr:hypothetical protein [Symploca sp. SIO2B6]